MNPDFPLTNEEIKQILAWAYQAGEIAMGYFRNVSAQLKHDNSFLTQADLEIEAFLVERLQANFPDYGLVGEEGARSHSISSAEHFWAIDPIDGTTPFVQGLPGWGIAIGLLSRGKPSFGLFYMPLLDDITYTSGPGETICRDCLMPKIVRRDWKMKGFLATTSFVHRLFDMDVPRVRAMGSVNANVIYIARGAATAGLFPKAHLWDIVACGAVLSTVGGELRYLSGQQIDYLELLDGRVVPEPVIAGHPEVLDELQSAIRPLPFL